jgi:malonyl CoA-acyl carrier protein transacylase
MARLDGRWPDMPPRISPRRITMSLVCMFPGQGSQSKGMGAALFDRFPDWTAGADAVLGYSIRELCVEDPRSELGLTTFTQPALFVVNAMTYRARAEDGQPTPSWLVGHSLGEYNALLAAGVFDFAAGLRLVQRRGVLMGQVRGGGMAAVIGLEPARIAEVLAGTDAGGRIDVANFNSFDQTVIAGPKEDLAAVEAAFTAAGARAFITLNVSAPFHSRYMRAAMDEFAAFIDGFVFAVPAVPVLSNVTARPYAAEAGHETLARQIGHSVKWLDSMLFLLDQGVSEFEEVGPGSVLTKLLAQIKKKRKAGPTAP